MRSAQLSIGAVLVVGLAVASAPTAARANSVTVNPGSSIQAAIDAASPGDTIYVMPGDYNAETGVPAAITINKPLRLIAKSNLPSVKVRILPNTAVTGQIHGILAEPANPGDPDINGLVIKGFTVEGFQNMGIWLKHVKNYTIEGNESINNLENGIFPTLSANGLVKRNVAYGSQDSALWVEGSQKVRVVKNELAMSPTGLEITISKDITVERNDVHDNSVGVGLYNPATAGLPQAEWPAGPYGNWRILDNHVHHNNVANTAVAGSETAQLPNGGGILVLGVQNVNVRRNLVERNDFFGVAMIDYCLAVYGTPFDCSTNPPPAPTAPSYIQVTGNKLIDNHAFPPAGPFQPLASDILQLGGSNDCFSRNTIYNEASLSPPTTIPSPLAPQCP
jgi:parallel beta-helix repeat protein